MCFVKLKEKRNKLTCVFSRHILKTVPPAIKIISLKNGDRLIATIGPSATPVYHSALEALKHKKNYGQNSLHSYLFY